MNLYQTFFSIILFLTGLTDLIRIVNFGGITGLGIMTLATSFGTWFLVFTHSKIPKIVFIILWALFFFLVLAIISWILNFSSLSPVNVIQNLTVYIAFIGFTTLSTIQSYRSFELPEYISKYLPKAIQVSVTIYGLSLVIGGPGSSVIMSARSFALFAVIGVAWFLAAWRYGLPGSLFWVSFAVVALAFSFSRTALIIALLLFPLSQISFTSIKALLKMGLIIVLIVMISFLAFTFVEPIRSRFTSTGDNATVGGVQVNTSGRGTAWPVAYASALESPWIGKGPSSVGIVLLERVGPEFAHPHNDYLRIFHDFGLFGLTFWLLGYWGLIIKVCQNWQWADKNDRENAHIHLASFLALIAEAIAMMSDNVVVYIFVMAPLGILVGASCGSGSRRQKTIKSARKLAALSGSLR
jgi:O-antigen ligase